MSCLLLGYDVETSCIEDDERQYTMDGKATEVFIASARRIHEELEAPCTLYITGITLRNFRTSLAALHGHPLFDMQSHTYDHIRFKTVMDRRIDGKTTLYPGGEPIDIAISVARNKSLIEEFFGTECIGVCTPYGSYRGLSDRIDLLTILNKLGVKFVRSYGRNHHDASPVDIDIQPFWYGAQGYPDILEIMFHGWIDAHYRRLVGYEDWDAYVSETKKWIDMAVEKDLDLSLCQHDWTSVLHDRDMQYTKEILGYAKRRGCQLCTATDYYSSIMRKREGYGGS